MLSALALGGCSSSIGGYLPVEDVPPDRDQAAIPLAEQTKIKKELLAARDRQASVPKDQGQGQNQNQGPSQNQGPGQNQGSQNQASR